MNSREFSLTALYMLSVRAFNQFTPLAHVQVTPPGWQEVVRAMENSSYFESLEVKAKERYREKLSCVVYLSKTTLICQKTMQDSSMICHLEQSSLLTCLTSYLTVLMLVTISLENKSRNCFKSIYYTPEDFRLKVYL